MYVCMHVCVCIHKYIYIYVYIYLRAFEQDPNVTIACTHEEAI